MAWPVRLIAAALLLFLVAMPCSGAPEDASELSRGVVMILSSGGDGPRQGTGFIVSASPEVLYLVTASHVVAGDHRPRVEFYTQRDRPVRATVEHDESQQNGLALLLVTREDGIPDGIASLMLDPLMTLKPADTVLVIGNPRQEGPWSVAKRGVESIRGNQVNLDMGIDPGYSGAPVIKDGKVEALVIGDRYTCAAAVPSDAIYNYVRRLVPDRGTGPPVDARAGDLWTSPTDNKQMIYVPPGDFIMGSPKGDGDPDEQPQRQVYLDAFWIDKTEVTNAEYRRFVEATGHRVPRYWDSAQLNRPGQPVVGVSWEDAQAYARWAGKHLPTEAEWEKAARGTDGRKYPWGNVWDAGATRRCNVLDRDDPTALGSVVSTDGYGCTAPVGSYPLGESPYGCLDMAGNAWEWCADWYDSEYYGSGLRQNPRGAPGGEFRVLRGGSCESLAWELRCADRYYLDPSCMSGSTGFRCALSAE